MKKYFAKYLPVEGEIKEGDKAKEKYSINPKIVNVIAVNVDGLVNCEGQDLWYAPEALQKVKLFLCSRDIAVGDKVYEELADGTYGEEFEWTEEINKYNSTDCVFKVIGEISPEATWVKEGDEFDEDELGIKEIDINNEDIWTEWDFQDKGWEENLKKGLVSILVQIKGPCGHFH